MKLRVECYSGNKADERPVRFYLGEQLRMVEEILDQWYGPNDIFFKVRADDGNLYILSTGTSNAGREWSLESFREITRPTNSPRASDLPELLYEISTRPSSVNNAANCGAVSTGGKVARGVVGRAAEILPFSVRLEFLKCSLFGGVIRIASQQEPQRRVA